MDISIQDVSKVNDLYTRYEFKPGPNMRCQDTN